MFIFDPFIYFYLFLFILFIFIYFYLFYYFYFFGVKNKHVLLSRFKLPQNSLWNDTNFPAYRTSKNSIQNNYFSKFKRLMNEKNQPKIFKS